jgi:hypothetical protein
MSEASDRYATLLGGGACPSRSLHAAPSVVVWWLTCLPNTCVVCGCAGASAGLIFFGRGPNPRGDSRCGKNVSACSVALVLLGGSLRNFRCADDDCAVLWSARTAWRTTSVMELTLSLFVYTVTLQVTSRLAIGIVFAM